MTAGGRREGAGRPRKNVLRETLSDTDLLEMSIMEIEASKIRPKIRDILIKHKLEMMKGSLTSEEQEARDNEMMLIYEWIKSLGAEFGLDLQAFIESKLPYEVSVSSKK